MCGSIQFHMLHLLLAKKSARNGPKAPSVSFFFILKNRVTFYLILLCQANKNVQKLKQRQNEKEKDLNIYEIRAWPSYGQNEMRI